MSNPVLWRPSQQRIEHANIVRFMKTLRATGTAEVDDYEGLYRWSIEHPARFWPSVRDFCGIITETQGDCVVENPDSFETVRWFPGARLNFAENLLQMKGDRAALEFYGENGSHRVLSFDELRAQALRLSRALTDFGIAPGDRIAAYLPNLPETIVAMLAATGIGAVWSSCSPDFGVAALLDRFGQIRPRILFAADRYFYNGREFDLSARVESILKSIDSIELLVWIPYQGDSEGPAPAPGVWMEDLVRGHSPAAVEFEAFPFDHPVYILYSSGTTGAPKCILHGAGGTLLQHFKEHQLLADVHPADRLFYFTTCGWMMWNWLVSGLGSGATLILYDGSPVYPDGNRLFDLIDQAGIDILGVSAGFIDSVRKAGLKPRLSHRLARLKTILSTGSPLAPENFEYVYRDIKQDLCLSSISGGTDIISCFVAGPPTVPVRRGEIQCRALGMSVAVFDGKGRSMIGKKGELVCTRPFPSMPVGFWNDPDRKAYHRAYFDRFPNVWCHGDFAEITESGGVIIYGRSDSVLNPGGVRIGTAEIYRQVGQIEEVRDSVVIAQSWQGDVRIVLFVRMTEGLNLTEELKARIKSRIREFASPRHVPSKIIQVADIPYTKSGKLVESAVREVVHGRPVKNIEALANPEALENFKGIQELLE
ncbi:MAG: acetoacetate--CoA ligase [Methylococcaceae bacterium]|nr:acetoacetate--CoA ligase [Methylococcaceae bacterium]